MNVFLDDSRMGPCYDPDDAQDPFETDWWQWVICRHVDDVKDLLIHGLVEDLSLDHDMGCDVQGLPFLTGMSLLQWMAETGHWPHGKITVHSCNFPARDRMLSFLKQFRPQE